MIEPAYYHLLVSRVVRGTRWIVAHDVAAGAVDLVAMLHDAGAEAVLVLAGCAGTGALPEGCEIIDLGMRSTSLMASIRSYERALASLPASVVTRIEEFDPDGNARVLGTIFGSGEPVLGRRVYGARLATWRALEDKTVVDDLWDAAGVSRAPREIVAATGEAMWAAHQRLDRGLGTVWVADNREGWHGGATGVRWVGTAEEGAAAAEFLESIATRARVMPFLEGIPCSIHGIIGEDEAIALRPVEMLVFRRPQERALVYAGVSTSWLPAEADSEAMRQVALTVAEHLRSRCAYRGAFTVDGILGIGGFLPTELNPRFGAGLGALARGVPELPLYFLHAMLIEGEPFDFQLSELAITLCQAQPETTMGRALQIVSSAPASSQEQPFRWTEAGCVAAPSGEPDGTLLYGEHSCGGLVLLRCAPGRVPIGPAFSRRAAQAFALADQIWSTGIGELVPMAEVSAAGRQTLEP